MTPNTRKRRRRPYHSRVKWDSDLAYQLLRFPPDDTPLTWREIAERVGARSLQAVAAWAKRNRIRRYFTDSRTDLEQFRRVKGLTTAQLADRLGLSAIHVRKLLSGALPLTYSVAGRLLGAFPGDVYAETTAGIIAEQIAESGTKIERIETT